MAATPGFGPKAFEFFDRLELDNSRDFFQSHKQTFEAEIRDPLATLIDSLPDTYQPFKVFRMNRDVRFAKDKSPYKLMHGAVHEDKGAVHYLHVDADGFLVATGAYLLSPPQLHRFRQAVADDTCGAKLVRLVKAIEKKGLTVDPGGAEPLTTAPHGYPKDHPRIDLLRHKGLVASDRLTGAATADGDALRAFVLKVFADARPLTTWLAANVGGTTDDSEVHDVR